MNKTVTLPTGRPKPPEPEQPPKTPFYFTFTYEGVIEDVHDFFSDELEEARGNGRYDSELDGTKPWTVEKVAELLTVCADKFGGIGELICECEMIDLSDGDITLSMEAHGTQAGI